MGLTQIFNVLPCSFWRPIFTSKRNFIKIGQEVSDIPDFFRLSLLPSWILKIIKLYLLNKFGGPRGIDMPNCKIGQSVVEIITLFHFFQDGGCHHLRFQKVSDISGMADAINLSVVSPYVYSEAQTRRPTHIYCTYDGSARYAIHIIPKLHWHDLLLTCFTNKFATNPQKIEPAEFAIISVHDS